MSKFDDTDAKPAVAPRKWHGSDDDDDGEDERKSGAGQFEDASGSDEVGLAPRVHNHESVLSVASDYDFASRRHATATINTERA